MGNAIGFGNSEPLGNVAVERENFCQRLGNSLCGVCVGIFLFVGSIVLLGWNEFNYVRNQAILLKVEKETIEAGCLPSLSNAGEPIWASCAIQRAYDFSTDARVQQLGLTFSNKLQGAWFKAESKILQWTEDKGCSSHSTTGGGKEKVCTYDYNLEWVSSPVSSSDFYCYPNWRPGCDRSGAEIRNSGSVPNLLQQTLQAPVGSVGMGASVNAVYYLDNTQMAVFPPDPVSVSAGQSTLLPSKQVVVGTAGSVQFSSVPGRDTVGDVRTTFTQSQMHVGFTQVAIIALQGSVNLGGNAQLKPWNTGLPGTMSVVDWAMMGGFSKSDMIDEKQSENGWMVIGLRILGFLLMWFGLQLVTGPIALMPQILPCCGEMIGEMVGCALCCMNLLISLSLSLTVIGVAWLMARPLLGVGLLLVAALAVFTAGMLRKKFRKDARDPAISQPFMTEQGQANGIRMSGVAPVTAVAPQTTQVQVVCPQGVVAGQMLMIQCPDGVQRQVQVPAGVQPGQAFSVMV